MDTRTTTTLTNPSLAADAAVLVGGVVPVRARVVRVVGPGVVGSGAVDLVDES